MEQVLEAMKEQQTIIDIKLWNALALDYSKYDVIYAFWMPDTLWKRIAPKLKTELTAWSKFVSYCFSLKSDFLNEVKHKENEWVYAIYEYKKD